MSNLDNYFNLSIYPNKNDNFTTVNFNNLQTLINYSIFIFLASYLFFILHIRR